MWATQKQAAFRLLQTADSRTHLQTMKELETSLHGQNHTLNTVFEASPPRTNPRRYRCKGPYFFFRATSGRRASHTPRHISQDTESHITEPRLVDVPCTTTSAGEASKVWVYSLGNRFVGWKKSRHHHLRASMAPIMFPQLASPIHKNRTACAGSRLTAPSTLLSRRNAFKMKRRGWGVRGANITQGKTEWQVQGGAA